jgi:3-hydroxybutyryl-CoA dehydratase
MTDVAPVTKQLSQEQVQLYAGATGDHNPIHVDQAFARTTPFGGTIAHGMLVLASISEMMAASLGEDWLRHGKLHVRFKAPTRTNDTITAGAVQNTAGAYAVEVRNQAGDVLISGTAEVARDG